ncbi:unnamed protein product [Cochlearia groenlandica]
MTLSILVKVTFLSWPPPDPASAYVPQPTSESPMMLPLQPSEPPDPPDPPDSGFWLVHQCYFFFIHDIVHYISTSSHAPLLHCLSKPYFTFQKSQPLTLWVILVLDYEMLRCRFGVDVFTIFHVSSFEECSEMDLETTSSKSKSISLLNFSFMEMFISISFQRGRERSFSSHSSIKERTLSPSFDKKDTCSRALKSRMFDCFLPALLSCVEVTPGPEDTVEIALARSEVKDMLSKSQCKVIILQHIGFAMDMLSTLEDLFLGKMLLSSSFCLVFASKASYLQDFHALICIMWLLLCSKLRVLGTHIYLCNLNI